MASPQITQYSTPLLKDHDKINNILKILKSLASIKPNVKISTKTKHGVRSDERLPYIQSILRYLESESRHTNIKDIEDYVEEAFRLVDRALETYHQLSLHKNESATSNSPAIVPSLSLDSPNIRNVESPDINAVCMDLAYYSGSANQRIAIDIERKNSRMRIHNLIQRLLNELTLAKDGIKNLAQTYKADNSIHPAVNVVVENIEYNVNIYGAKFQMIQTQFQG
jgi:hypothetical protein